MQCCRMSGITTHGSIHSQLSEGLGSSAAGGTPQVTQSVAQAIDVQIAEVQGDWQQRCEHLAYQAGIQGEPTAVPVAAVAAMEVESGRLLQVDLATPRDCQAGQQDIADPPDPTAVSTWTEERMLELATSLPAMRTIRHQPRGLRQRTCAILKKLLQHHTHCHHQWVEKHDSESLQAEVAAARWAWLGPTLLVRAYEG